MTVYVLFRYEPYEGGSVRKIYADWNRAMTVLHYLYGRAERKERNPYSEFTCWKNEEETDCIIDTIGWKIVKFEVKA